ncbi:hypothetical protein NLJ89_g4661 [Agrocybe chaxingu]|uniref:Pre-mRNA-splicing factor Syf1-like N-terminal HAT-repeats domain-containing protein n=1 Tax=Agrocybe chaxingu TaxID=84603 RepID=A0A9W8K9E7_9AGAR|nr:hypothetical protein NLJ89_g4661 [Agrocybe chaxingu]
METRVKEYERARVVYKSVGLFAAYSRFEKQFGTRGTLELTVLGKRRIKYEEEVSRDGPNYDTWFDYTRLEESAYRDLKDERGTKQELDAASERVTEIYERAVAQVPPANDKRYWRRYLFLWLNYALFEEIDRKDYSRTREIYRLAIELVPHKQFTFAKLWLLFAKFEIRQLDLNAARKILGNAIGMCPKGALFKGYINLEIELREFDRARKLYEKYLEFDPANSIAWLKYAELESYIDFEIEEGERETARSLYERLTQLSGHVKVWISYAMFEAESIPASSEWEGTSDDEENRPSLPGDISLARQVFERGYQDLKRQGLKEERLVLLEVWKIFEEKHGTAEDVAKVERMMPIFTKRRHVDRETGQLVEDWDRVFPDDERENNPASFKFLQLARAWKQSQVAGDRHGQETPTVTCPAADKSEDDPNEEDNGSDVASSHEEASNE